mmetsp:Transcript_12995/g.16872  ORF Transcript_12995/g.16872 Transcript_12995/m.16872 type:complete len:285 (-) Transcript_12995:797-1651(-)
MFNTANPNPRIGRHTSKDSDTEKFFLSDNARTMGIIKLPTSKVCTLAFNLIMFRIFSVLFKLSFRSSRVSPSRSVSSMSCFTVPMSVWNSDNTTLRIKNIEMIKILGCTMIFGGITICTSSNTSAVSLKAIPTGLEKRKRIFFNPCNCWFLSFSASYCSPQITPNNCCFLSFSAYSSPQITPNSFPQITNSLHIKTQIAKNAQTNAPANNPCLTSVSSSFNSISPFSNKNTNETSNTASNTNTNVIPVPPIPNQVTVGAPSSRDPSIPRKTKQKHKSESITVFS